jgi:hypothetical protein
MHRVVPLSFAFSSVGHVFFDERRMRDGRPKQYGVNTPIAEVFPMSAKGPNQADCMRVSDCSINWLPFRYAAQFLLASFLAGTGAEGDIRLLPVSAHSCHSLFQSALRRTIRKSDIHVRQRRRVSSTAGTRTKLPCTEPITMAASARCVCFELQPCRGGDPLVPLHSV